MAEKIPVKTVTDNLRNAWMDTIKAALSADGQEVLQTACGTLYIPCLDCLGDDRWVKISVIIPKASEEDSSDGYSLAKAYEMHLAEQAEKKAAAEKAKAAKIAKDAEKRAAKKKKEA